MASTLRQGGWHRPVSLKSLLVVGGLVLVVWLAFILAVVWFVYTQLDARMELREQAVTLRLPPGLQAQAVLRQPLRTRVDLRPWVSVPVHQRLRAQVDDNLVARATLETTVSVDTVVRVDQVVPVKTELHMRVPLVGWLPAFNVTLPVTLNLPIQAEVPLRAQVPVRFDAQVSGELRAPIEVPLDTVFRLRPEIHEPVRAEVQGQMDFVVKDAMPPIPLTIERARLLAPFEVPSIRHRTQH